MIRICKNENAVYVPMLDARRMELYVAAYNNELEIVDEPKAMIVNEKSWSDLVAKNNKIIFGGPGVVKTATVLKNEKIIFLQDEICEAKNLFPIVLRKYKHRQFNDVAYSEPFYLKEFNERV
jgi:tRNA threonylcarbamoyladenosine biosynthesis protein TsaB